MRVGGFFTTDAGRFFLFVLRADFFAAGGFADGLGLPRGPAGLDTGFGFPAFFFAGRCTRRLPAILAPGNRRWRPFCDRIAPAANISC
jgi:hypothetical protein